MTNPFFNRGPIRESKFFFPRETESREVLRLVRGVQNCSLVGAVKSGKTSLLLHVANPATLEAHGLPPGQYSMVHLSFEGLGSLSAEQFFHLMLRETARQAKGKITLIWPRFEHQDSIRFLDLKDALKQLEVAGEKVVFCLDEVELAARNPAFDVSFFSALRNIGSYPGVCFVTATERRLHEIEVAGREVGSPFADLFSVVRLRPLEEGAAWEAVKELAGEAGVDLTPDREFIMETGGGWPYYLQTLSYEVFECRAGRPEGGLTEEERVFVRSRAYEQVEPVLSIMWERLGEEPREAALSALQDRGTAPEIEGLTRASGGVTRAVNSLTERFLRERHRDGAVPVEAYFTSEAAPPDRAMIYGVVRALMRAVEARDRYLRGHADRVVRYAVAIAQKMGCPSELTEGVKVAARLHDIGRVSISDMILLKPGPLTELETEIVRTHPIVAAQILDALDFPWSVKPAVRYHHERLDGSGYPEGLIGDEIPLGARVLGVADVMAAMTADRPYREARSEEEAISELEINAAIKYDSEVVRALVGVLRQGTV